MSNRFILPLVLAALAACSHESTPPETAAQTHAALPASLKLAAAPAAAMSVLDLRGAPQDGQEVVVTGRAKDFIATRAVFTIADMSLRSCLDKGDKMDCDTPWDYCCADPAAVTAGTAAIEVREGAEIVAGSVQGWNGLDHLVPVVVRGKLRKDDKGNLAVIADGIFVKS